MFQATLNVSIKGNGEHTTDEGGFDNLAWNLSQCVLASSAIVVKSERLAGPEIRIP